MTMEPVMAMVLATAGSGAATGKAVYAITAIGLTLAIVNSSRSKNGGRRRVPRHPRSRDRPAPNRPAGRSSSRPRGRPAIVPFSYWYALVPFEDTSQVKERPVLVLRQDGTNARVLKITSQDKQGRDNFHRVDTSNWDRPGKRGGSWVQTDTVVTVPLDSFQRCLGRELDPAFTQLLSRKHGNEFF